MIPPLPQATLDANPAFARVWEYVTTNVLENDASRRLLHEERRRKWREGVSVERRTTGSGEDEDGQDADEYTRGSSKGQTEDVNLEEELRKARVSRMKMEILREVLRDIAFVDHPDQTQDRVDMDEGPRMDFRTGVSLQQDRTPSSIGLADGELLLADDVALFKENIGITADAVGTRLVEIEREMSDIAALAGSNEMETQYGETDQVDINAIIASRQGQPAQKQSLVSTLTAQTSYLATLNDTLPTILTSLSSTLTTLQTLHRETLSQQIRALETTKHGVLSRWTTSRAQFLASVAKAMSLKTRIMVLEEQNNLQQNLPTEAITEKMVGLDEQETDLDRRIEALSDLLGKYEDLDTNPRRGVDVLRTLGRRYAEIEREIGVVREDIERLGRETK
ncbi:hypothetical protein LTR10_013571 [Elasticomyces elasticus]|uniref:Uncharacterized protein n=1 Tax=Exophiala sideris TaxID=1016849 RepID=A0ABR0JQZ9_9EURO|nr:hypothetical protein LTR10_013571 [Elasticomyces elasticus]KAK5039709.1 hypothetical protein LTS07_000204 [Exophiala sideris]KAK5041261.1 hypothetical protein LTR13_002736 [Exophiala sideris]KAK5068087.1 hypothetical protein LTR69_000205 [Exophiala sideris]KAK5187388.1 hypothetical protein LTR44_000204 [Eurotiomycetes sp. CCFEE 6388]